MLEELAKKFSESDKIIIVYDKPENKKDAEFFLNLICSYIPDNLLYVDELEGDIEDIIKPTDIIVNKNEKHYLYFNIIKNNDLKFIVLTGNYDIYNNFYRYLTQTEIHISNYGIMYDSNIINSKKDKWSRFYDIKIDISQEVRKMKLKQIKNRILLGN